MPNFTDENGNSHYQGRGPKQTQPKRKALLTAYAVVPPGTDLENLSPGTFLYGEIEGAAWQHADKMQYVIVKLTLAVEKAEIRSCEIDGTPHLR